MCDHCVLEGGPHFDTFDPKNRAAACSWRDVGGEHLLDLLADDVPISRRAEQAVDENHEVGLGRSAAAAAAAAAAACRGAGLWDGIRSWGCEAASRGAPLPQPKALGDVHVAPPAWLATHEERAQQDGIVIDASQEAVPHTREQGGLALPDPGGQPIIHA